MKRIFIPLDRSKVSEQPVRSGLHPLVLECAEVTLFHCVDPGSWSFPERPSSSALARKEQAARESSQRYLDGLAPLLRPLGHTVVLQTSVGLPVSEILKASQGFDLIIMTSRGRSGIQRLLLGSVAEEVLRRATLPVLVLPPEDRTH